MRAWPLRTLAKFLISIVLLMIVFRQINTDEVAASLQNLNFYWCFTALLMMSIQNIISGWKWSTLAKPLAINGQRRDFVKSTYEALFINLWLPSSLAGDAWRFRRLHVAQREAPRKKLLLSLVIDRLSIHVIWISAFLFSLPWLDQSALGALFTQRTESLAVFLAFSLGGVSIILLLSKTIRSAMYAGRSLFPHFGLGVLVCALVPVNLWLCMQAVGISLDVNHLLVASPLLLGALAMPIAFGNWGTREAAIAFLFGSGLNSSAALYAGSILFGILTMIAALPGLYLVANRT